MNTMTIYETKKDRVSGRIECNDPVVIDSNIYTRDDINNAFDYVSNEKWIYGMIDCEFKERMTNYGLLYNYTNIPISKDSSKLMIAFDLELFDALILKDDPIEIVKQKREMFHYVENFFKEYCLFARIMQEHTQPEVIPMGTKIMYRPTQKITIEAIYPNDNFVGMFFRALSAEPAYAACESVLQLLSSNMRIMNGSYDGNYYRKFSFTCSSCRVFTNN